MQRQVENSELIVEGEVVSKESFIGTDNNIYTVNRVEVFKVFKGDKRNQIEIITAGGNVGSRFQMVTHALDLQVGQIGLFNLKKITKSGVSDMLYEVYAGPQGFYKYNIYDDVVLNVFGGKRGISDKFYKDIEVLTKQDVLYVKPFSVKGATSKLRTAKGSLVPTGITFSPSTVSAGTKTTITISIASGATGDFGSQKGTVSFRNADTGGLDDDDLPDYIDALDTQITNWSTNSITVEVPARAGTGNIRVTDASLNVIDSSEDLIIEYAELNVNATFTIGTETSTYAFPTRLLNNDESGGYIWRMETRFDADVENAGAKADFINALDTWRCESGVNFSIGPVTSIDEAVVDGVNVIRFESGNELPEGVLGQCTYSFSGCGSSLENYEVFAEEMDLVFSNDEAWHFGAGLPGFEIDFRSVALHELGHAHQLNHVINDNDDVMHFSIGFGEQIRALSEFNKIAADNVFSRSEASVPVFGCFSGKSPMIEFDCQLSVVDNQFDDSIIIYPNPTSGVFYINNQSSTGLQELLIFDASGRQILRQEILEGENSKTINLSGVSKGLYFIHLISEKGNITSKLMIN
ncbi:T9SS type A sorting domain-containing protein [Cognatitamlana onchidii]|uniref:T9SS type A sorting domain-containing protein n=1 Tax=Cognatitamlana onchidii TaxID=2562860 RepID=UPI001455E087|nr:T9SS type A sorting domain-containing protein [Algibacter onchidii]